MKREVAATRPDLVIWQVGTNDALGHYALERFEGCLQRTLTWLKDQGVDVILLNPQYGEVLIKDAYYEKIVASIARVSAQESVLLVDRFGSMRGWARDRTYLSKDNLHMNDAGYARLAELLTSTIVKELDRERAIVAALD
jgi:lysophospholipase L1-like esterase